MGDNFFGLTDVGRVRSNNEDTFIAQPIQQNRLILAGVIDGVGGYDGGEIAADIARTQMIDHLSGSASGVEEALAAAFRAANEQIFVRKQQDKQLSSMACVATLAVADVAGNQFHYAHVGDTRLYLLRDHSLVKITKDHSFVGFLEDSGRLTESAAMSHPKRNEINKALGFDPAIASENDYIEIGRSPFLPGDTLLLCSDGLTDMVDKEEISRILTTAGALPQKAQQLIAAANQNGGRDNVTVVLVHNNKAPAQQTITRPAAIAGKAPGPVTDAPPVTPSADAVPQSHPEPAVAQKKSYGLVALLSLLCLMLLAAVVWLYLNRTGQPAAVTNQPVQAPAKPPTDTLATRLQTALSQLKGDTLLLSAAAFPRPVKINEAIRITRDTLYIKTEGKVQLLCDSGYTGPALVLAANCKHVVISGLTLHSFATGISASGNALQLKSVQFINCLNPLLVAYAAPADKPVSGTVPALTFHTDTLTHTATPTHAAR